MKKTKIFTAKHFSALKELYGNRQPNKHDGLQREEEKVQQPSNGATGADSICGMAEVKKD
jgi:hypothetical protein